MCSRPYESKRPRINPEVYRPSKEVLSAVNQTLGKLMLDSAYTAPIGRSMLGAQYYVTGGWFHNPEANQVSELKVDWLKRSSLANFILNPHRPKQLLGSLSLDCRQLDADPNSSGPDGPHRLYLLNPPQNKVSSLTYHDDESILFESEDLIFSDMRPQSPASTMGIIEGDPLSPDTERTLVETLTLGNQVGWQAIDVLQ